MVELERNLNCGKISWVNEIIFIPPTKNDMWLLITNETDFKGYSSFNRLAKDIGLPKEVKKPSHPLKIGKYTIRQIEVDERL